MAKAFIEEDTLTAIGDAIRSKGNTTDLLKPSEMADAIRSMVVGEQVIPDEVFTEGHPDNSYRFYATNMNWLLENYADYFEPLSLSRGMFMENVSLKTIPITLTPPNFCDVSQAFWGCDTLTEITNFDDLPNKTLTPNNTEQMFYGCMRLRTLPTNLFGANYTTTGYNGVFSEWKRHQMFENCYSLRKLPNISGLDDGGTNHEISIYYYMCHNCYVLDEAIDLPVSRGTYTNNMFNRTFNQAYRIKEVKFVVNTDGTAKTANWSNQVLNLSYYMGWNNSNENHIYGYNSGISGGRVSNDSNYATLKDTDYWWSNDYRYSRYNLTSLVNTINTLPDTSAFLSTNGGNNTIKIRKNAGIYTDGGAVSDITEEQAAVATAKGWTIAITDYESIN